MKSKNNCPFCLLGCEFSLKKESKQNNCADLNYHLQHHENINSPTIKGDKVCLEEAVEKVKELLSKCKGIHVDGLGCDYEGIRSIFEFAENFRTSLDHMEGENISNMNLVSQRIGGNFCSIGEVYKRSDLVFFSVEDFEIIKTFIDFLNKKKQKRKYFIISENKKNLNIKDTVFITKYEFLKFQNSFTHNRKFKPSNKRISDNIYSSQFVTFLCNFSENQDFSRKIFGFVEYLNQINKRSSILPINGKNNISGAVQYCLWKTGFPLRVQFTDIGVDYNPIEYKSNLIAKRKELQIYINCFQYKKNINMFKKNIFIGNPLFKNKKDFDVFIPVMIPGIHKKGLVLRGDGVTTIKLDKITESEYESVSQIFKRIYSNS